MYYRYHLLWLILKSAGEKNGSLAVSMKLCAARMCCNKVEPEREREKTKIGVG